MENTPTPAAAHQNLGAGHRSREVGRSGPACGWRQADHGASTLHRRGVPNAVLPSATLNKTILIVEDSPSIRLTLTTLLSLSGFQVETAEDGEEALGRLRRGFRPDLIITDLHMPRMDGLALTRAARQLLPSTPILLLTVENRRDQRELGRQAGATAWVLKPVKPATLLNAIQRVMPGP